jgi:hypothetical protein
LSGGGSNLETYTEHQALLLGHTLGRNGRQSVAIGVGKSKRWEVPYYPCTGDACWFGAMRKGEATTTADGPSLALAAETRTGPMRGVLALGLELTAFFRKDASTVGLNIALNVGLLK